jgi:hypothetical protein
MLEVVVLDSEDVLMVVEMMVVDGEVVVTTLLVDRLDVLSLVIELEVVVNIDELVESELLEVALSVAVVLTEVVRTCASDRVAGASSNSNWRSLTMACEKLVSAPPNALCQRQLARFFLQQRSGCGGGEGRQKGRDGRNSEVQAVY